MKKYLNLFFVLSQLSALSQTIGLKHHDPGSLDNGYVLFTPVQSTNTYLIDKCGRQVKKWQSTYQPGLSVYILPDGTLLRSGQAGNKIFASGGNGGIIQKIDWDGNVTWTYTISDSFKCQHHDIKALPNGNILLIAWELKASAEAIASGRKPALIGAHIWSEQILEIQPSGSSGGTVVWQWHAWDHLVQDFDSGKLNFGTVSSSPQLISVNYSANASTADWLHFNSIDYNAKLDQILISVHNFNEVWIIDHSTTAIEAATNKGGNSGKGGDLLYRWGNPAAYANGTPADKKFYGQHNAYWIDSTLPYGNNIMVFNNGNGRTGGNYSTVEIIDPPFNGVSYDQSLPFLPASNSWNYNAGNPNSFYAMNISGAQQLPGGNILICNGPAGTFSEVNSAGEMVWEYVNPVNGMGIINQGNIPSQNSVFRCSFYPVDYSGFKGHTLASGNVIESANTASDSCSVFLNVNGIEANFFFEIFPNPATDYIILKFGKINIPGATDYKIYNSLGAEVLSGKISNTSVKISTQELTQGTYFIRTISGDLLQTKLFIRQ